MNTALQQSENRLTFPGIDASAGKPYRPANGSEGGAFMAIWCENCQKDANQESDGGCRILANSMCCEVGDPDYPTELKHNSRGVPCCTAFVRRT